MATKHRRTKTATGYEYRGVDINRMIHGDYIGLGWAFTLGGERSYTTTLRSAMAAIDDEMGQDNKEERTMSNQSIKPEHEVLIGRRVIVTLGEDERLHGRLCRHSFSDRDLCVQTGKHHEDRSGWFFFPEDRAASIVSEQRWQLGIIDRDTGIITWEAEDYDLWALIQHGGVLLDELYGAAGERYTVRTAAKCAERESNRLCGVIGDVYVRTSRRGDGNLDGIDGEIVSACCCELQARGSATAEEVNEIIDRITGLWNVALIPSDKDVIYETICDRLTS